MLPFKENETTLTLGVEVELQLINADSLHLVPKAPFILKKIKHPRITKEMFRSTIELVTDVCKDVHEARKDLNELESLIRPIAKEMNIRFAGTGTHPTALYTERQISPVQRYQDLLDRNQWLIRRMAVYGLHVHVGMRDGDHCIRFMNFFSRMVPHLIALSASSPFWRGMDTGLAAVRPTTYEAHPTSGQPVHVTSWNAFENLYDEMILTKSIESMKDIWWDIRPSPGYGTMEIRICDGLATKYELDSIVAFIHALAGWYEDHMDEYERLYGDRPVQWILRENKWRAIRFGLNAELISHADLKPHLLREDTEEWLLKIQPYFEKYKYDTFKEGIHNILNRGNSAQRQRSVMTKTGQIKEVVKSILNEYDAGTPDWN